VDAGGLRKRSHRRQEAHDVREMVDAPQMALRIGLVFRIGHRIAGSELLG
jgi:hypothetical protein